MHRYEPLLSRPGPSSANVQTWRYGDDRRSPALVSSEAGFAPPRLRTTRVRVLPRTRRVSKANREDTTAPPQSCSTDTRVRVLIARTLAFNSASAAHHSLPPPCPHGPTPPLPTASTRRTPIKPHAQVPAPFRALLLFTSSVGFPAVCACLYRGLAGTLLDPLSGLWLSLPPCFSSKLFDSLTFCSHNPLLPSTFDLSHPLSRLPKVALRISGAPALRTSGYLNPSPPFSAFD